jgi:hypothetical protein
MIFLLLINELSITRDQVTRSTYIILNDIFCVFENVIKIIF